MSRIGNKPIVIPDGVDINIKDNNVTVKGPNGSLDVTLHDLASAKIEDGEVLVVANGGSKQARSIHGLSRTLIANMVQGVTEGFKKELEIRGVGYRAEKDGNTLILNLGFSHQIRMPEIDGVTVEVPEQTKIIVSGTDKQAVGQFAAEVRNQRPPEPYKGKGIRYVGEYVPQKEGKAGKATTAT